jgi:CheY-like chemotaxis protein
MSLQFMSKKRILILDPERDMADLLARVAEARGNTKCYVATRDEEAEALFRDIPVDMALIDMERACLHDYRLLYHIKRLFPKAAIILLAYAQQRQDIQNIHKSLMDGILFKPVAIHDFRKWLSDFENSFSP